MRVLFVYSNYVRDLLPAPPIGLSYVASATADAGHEVELVDLLLDPTNPSRLQKKIRSFQPDCVAVSVRNIDNVVRQRLKKHMGELGRQMAAIRAVTGAPIVIGGPAISVLGREALKHIDADFAVLGEGEHSFPELLAEMAGDRRYWRVPGLLVRGARDLSQVEHARSRSFGASGMERWVDWRRYERLGATWPIQTKRGCPLHCTYCTYPSIEGRAMRRRSPEEIVAEIRRVQREVGPRCFEFIDSVFNMPQSSALELMEAIIRADLRVNLTTMGVNPRFLSTELLVLMRRAGFKSLMITPESASDPVLAAMRKGFTRDEVAKGAELVRASGITSMWFFMLGAPGETHETADETVRFAETELRWSNALVMFTTGIRILPGTELAQQALVDGYLPANQDLIESVFYFSPEVDEDWLLRRVDSAIALNPNVVHAAEDPSGTVRGQRIHALLHLAGLAPPYWRYLPKLLGLPWVQRARVRQAAARSRFGDVAPDQVTQGISLSE